MLLIVIVFLAMLSGVFMKYYNQWQGEKRVEALKQELEKREQAHYEATKADKIGGDTPKETLSLFILAVEKGNYKKASQYFVLEKQEGELRSLRESPKENIENVIRMLKESKNIEGSYSDDRKFYVIRQPILVSFTKYPSGNWKIEEI